MSCMIFGDNAESKKCHIPPPFYLSLALDVPACVLSIMLSSMLSVSSSPSTASEVSYGKVVTYRDLRFVSVFFVNKLF